MSYGPRRPRREGRTRKEGGGLPGKRNPDQRAKRPADEIGRKAREAGRKARRLEDRVDGRRR